MNKIQDIKIEDLLPHSLVSDPDVVALAKALNEELKDITVSLDEARILSRIDELPNDVLDHLLWQFSIGYEDGIGLADTIEEKRRLVKDAINLHRTKGTKAALKKVLELLGMRGVIEEWFEYGGEPYHFRIKVLEVVNLSEEKLKLLDKLIAAYKNTRSWLEVVNIYLTAQGTAYFGSSLIAGERITVYPWNPNCIEEKTSMNLATASQSSEKTTIYPLYTLEDITEQFSTYYAATHHTIEITSTYPKE